MCTPGHTAAKHVPAKPPVAIPHQCLKPLTHIQQFSKLQRNARKEALQINRMLILHPACTTYTLLRGSVHGSQRCFSVFEKQARITLGLSGTFQEILSFLDRLLFWEEGGVGRCGSWKVRKTSPLCVPTSHDNLLPKLGWSMGRLSAGCTSEIKRKGRAKDEPQCLFWKEQHEATGEQSCCPFSSFHMMT